MDLELRDKSVVITGGSRGIGRSIARSLALEGCNCLIASRTESDLRATADAISSESGRRVEICASDLSTLHGCEHLHNATMDTIGQLDILINNAGATRRGAFLDLDEQAWADGFALKFYACVRLSRLFWPALKQSRGAIVNVIGSAARTPSKEFTIGGAVNSAMANFTKAIADLGLDDDVNVNAVYPGLTQTDRAQTRFTAAAEAQGVTVDEIREQICRDERIRRIGAPDDVADIVAYLSALPRRGTSTEPQ